MSISYLVFPGTFPEQLQPTHLGTRTNQPVDNIPHKAKSTSGIFMWKVLPAFFLETLQGSIQSSETCWLNLHMYDEQGNMVYHDQWLCDKGENELGLELNKDLDNGKYFIDLVDVISGNKISRKITKGNL